MLTGGQAAPCPLGIGLDFVHVVPPAQALSPPSLQGGVFAPAVEGIPHVSAVFPAFATHLSRVGLWPPFPPGPKL
jgi:hypothetical protein